MNIHWFIKYKNYRKKLKIKKNSFKKYLKYKNNYTNKFYIYNFNIDYNLKYKIILIQNLEINYFKLIIMLKFILLKI